MRKNMHRRITFFARPVQRQARDVEQETKERNIQQRNIVMHTRSVSHAHFLCTFSLRDVQTRTCMAQCVCSAHVISLHLTSSLPSFSPHPSLSHVSSAVLVVPARSLRHLVPVCTFLAELSPIRKRGSSALPHGRRGVGLPGRIPRTWNWLTNTIFRTVKKIMYMMMSSIGPSKKAVGYSFKIFDPGKNGGCT